MSDTTPTDVDETVVATLELTEDAEYGDIDWLTSKLEEGMYTVESNGDGSYDVVRVEE
ncbi:hypothetical protein [Halosegnis longus]|uniref:hypothetical protein n=1 Tax=Halosegnis longus TaxID=2216012 RepID=UPI00129ED877|nr:hypothetical protein [Halosegnis longus]